MKKSNLAAIFALVFIVGGCGTDGTKTAGSSAEVVPVFKMAVPNETTKEGLPLGVQFNEYGSTYLSRQGLTVLNTPPKDEGAEILS